MPNFKYETFETRKITADSISAGTDTLKQNSHGLAIYLNKLWIFTVSQKSRVQNLSALVIINFITAGLGFITTVKVANVLGKENFGEFAYALAIGAYAAAVVRYGFDRTLVRDLTHYPDRFNDLVFASLALRAFLLVLVSAGLVIWKLFFTLATGLSWAAIIIVIGAALRSLDLQPVYDTWRQFKRHAIYDLIQKCLYFACIWFIAVVYPDKLAISWIGLITLCSITLYLFLQHRWAMNNIGRVTTSISFLSKSALSMWFSESNSLEALSRNRGIRGLCRRMAAGCCCSSVIAWHCSNRKPCHGTHNKTGNKC
jgi:O-antigen/teichoic acid export membrane protein